ncbi:hypothetical protein C8F01DRAFT_1092753 [Mycena amicta]|nr:hypothetical protein C8F01DRAFT_1092753 [Mycena amicta]
MPPTTIPDVDLCRVIFQRRVGQLRESVSFALKNRATPYKQNEELLINAYLAIATRAALVGDTLREDVVDRVPKHDACLVAHAAFRELFLDAKFMEDDFELANLEKADEARRADRAAKRARKTGTFRKADAAGRRALQLWQAALTAAVNRNGHCAVKDRAGLGMVVFQIVGKELELELTEIVAAELHAVDTWFYAMGRADNILQSRDCHCALSGVCGPAVRDEVEVEVANSIRELERDHELEDGHWQVPAGRNEQEIEGDQSQ